MSQVEGRIRLLRIAQRTFTSECESLIEIMNDGYLNAGTYIFNLTSMNLAKGIYFLRYIDNINQKEIKLILE